MKILPGQGCFQYRDQKRVQGSDEDLNQHPGEQCVDTGVLREQPMAVASK